MSRSDPTLAEIIRIAGETRERDVFTSLVAVVQSYDPGTTGPPTVDVQPVIKRALDGPERTTVHEELPVVTNVPVAFPSAGSMTMTWPIAKGDHVLLVCTAWSHQAWRETGMVSEPGDLRTHELGYAYAIPGVRPNLEPMATDAAACVMSPAAHVRVGGPAADWVVREALIQARLGELFAALTAAVPKVGGLDGGLQFKTQLLSALGSSGWSAAGAASTAATKLKAE